MQAPGPPKNIKSKKGPEQLAKEFADKTEYAKRKKMYQFGNAKIPLVLPTDYPDDETARADVGAALQLEFSMGYNGSDQTARNNVIVSDDGKTLVYHVAAIPICIDLESGKQRFYEGHNDDVSAIDVKGTLCASGQVDPKDRDKAAKPSIHIWDINDMSSKCIIEDAADAQVKCLAWSPCTKYLYSLGGDENQSMRMWDSDNFTGGAYKGKALLENPTCKDEMFGLVISPKPNPDGSRTGTVDEFLMWGRRRAAWGYIKSAVVKGNTKLFFQYRSINFSKVMGKGKSESVYLAGDFLPSGQWVVGSPKGNIYIGLDTNPQKRVKACDGFIGAIQLLGGDAGKTNKGGQKRDGIASICTVSKGGVQFFTCDTKGNITENTDEANGPVASGPIEIENVNIVPRAMKYNPTNNTVYIGSKDNKIVQYDFGAKQGKILVDGHDGQIWGLACSTQEPLFVTAGYDGVMKVIDVTTREEKARYTWPVIEEEKDGKTKTTREQVTCCAWSDNGKMIAAGTESSQITIFTWLKGVLKMEQTVPVIKGSAKGSKKGGKFSGVEPVSFLRFSPTNPDGKNEFLAAAHYDSNAYMFTVRSQREYAKVELVKWKKPLPHTAATTGLQFSTIREDAVAPDFLRTFNRNYEVMNWALHAQKKKAVNSTSLPDPDVWSFSHNPLIAGWDVEGLFLQGWDGTDLNAAAVNKDRNLVISGDDFGMLRLANYPSVGEDIAQNSAYQAHSAFVVSVEFSNFDGKYAISVGGNDKAVFGWTVNPIT